MRFLTIFLELCNVMLKLGAFVARRTQLLRLGSDLALDGPFPIRERIFDKSLDLCQQLGTVRRCLRA